ncbi:hypothetical protein [Metabacillus sp. 22489]|uniref:hypothetical protein n=1 Tax=Metabacillus sp. 22489 TaxID=3453928 RepID=UPI003F87015F
MKNIKSSILVDEAKHYDQFIELPIQYYDKTYHVKLYPFFKNELIRDLVDELIALYQNASKEGLKIKPEDNSDLVLYFIARKFTDIKFSKGKKAKTIYNEFKQVFNSKTFLTIIKQFPEESIKEVFERISEVIAVSGKMQGEYGDLIREKIKDLPLENKDVFSAGE